jgi:hypothetical protein
MRNEEPRGGGEHHVVLFLVSLGELQPSQLRLAVPKSRFLDGRNTIREIGSRVILASAACVTPDQTIDYRVFRLPPRT